ncbi:hypothetical protein EJD97_001241 [Solanum chilense]|uniref:Gag-pol polyprotein n=1 Tax=Solanum chilense TaxID=4083 RepID=A0A6N2C101_SOLCI|nr:hypothetical protein EJD97_001241 [Solanum chilense]
MYTRRKNARRDEEKSVNEVVPPQAPQNPEFLIEEGPMSNFEIMVGIHRLNNVLATQVARDTKVQVNSNTNNTASRIKDFTRMNPPTFFASKVEKDLQGFIYEVFKGLDTMRVTYREKEELDT